MSMSKPKSGTEQRRWRPRAQRWRTTSCAAIVRVSCCCGRIKALVVAMLATHVWAPHSEDEAIAFGLDRRDRTCEVTSLLKLPAVLQGSILSVGALHMLPPSGTPTQVYERVAERCDALCPLHCGVSVRRVTVLPTFSGRRRRRASPHWHARGVMAMCSLAGARRRPRAAAYCRSQRVWMKQWARALLSRTVCGTIYAHGNKLCDHTYIHYKLCL